MVGSPTDGDEDAPEPRAARAGVPARDAAGPQPPGEPAAPGGGPLPKAPHRAREEAQLDALLGARAVAHRHGRDRRGGDVRDPVLPARLGLFAAHPAERRVDLLACALGAAALLLDL